MYNPSLISNFPYRELPHRVPETATLAYRQRILDRFLEMTKVWSPQLQSEWIARNYLASKLILAAAVKLSTAEYATDKRMFVVRPYLVYYGLFHACRVFAFTTPFISWRDGALRSISHTTLANMVIDELRRLDPSVSDDTKTILTDARTHRELFSYQFPAEGPESVSTPPPVSVEDAKTAAKLLCEIAQLNSEALEQAFLKRSPSTECDDQLLTDICCYESIDGKTFVDDEDRYRVSQIALRDEAPLNIRDQTREGFVDDFCAGWGAGADEQQDEDYSADVAGDYIFPFR